MIRLFTYFILLCTLLVSSCANQRFSSEAESGVELPKSAYTLKASLKYDTAVVDWDENTISKVDLIINNHKVTFPSSYLNGVEGIHHDSHSLMKYSDHYILSFYGGDGAETFVVNLTIKDHHVVSGEKAWSVPVWDDKHLAPIKHISHSQKLPLPNKTLHPTSDRGFVS